jgi:VCBS repeat-containing protein
VLQWNVSVPQSRISVKVDHGVVTLSGDVDWLFERDEAERAIRRLSGVRDVVNTVTVRSRMQSADVQERVQQALERCAEFEASYIVGTVKDAR